MRRFRKRSGQVLAFSLAAVTFAGGSPAISDQCGQELSPDEISQIVDRHLEQTIGTGERWPDKEIHLTRHGCDYFYVESSTTEPILFGDWFVMMIDQNGVVIDYHPGY